MDRSTLFLALPLAGSFVGGCAPRVDAPPPPACGVTADGASEVEQAEEAINLLAPRVRYFLDADAGGPLTCRPGPGACDPCQGAVVELPSDAQATLAVEVQSDNPLTVGIGDVRFADDGDVAFVVLAPIPTESQPGVAAEIFIGVTPAAGAEIATTLLVTTNAENQLGDPFPIGLRVRGVE